MRMVFPAARLLETFRRNFPSRDHLLNRPTLVAHPLQIIHQRAARLDGQLVEVGAPGKIPRGIRTPVQAPDSLGKTAKHTEKDTGIAVSSGHDLSQVVNAWAKLSAPLKAAILAIINSTTSGKEGQL